MRHKEPASPHLTATHPQPQIDEIIYCAIYLLYK